MRWISFVAAVLIVSTGCSDKKAKGTAEGGKELEVTAPETLKIKQGETRQVTVKISRKNFNEPVDIDISGLPEGVTIEGAKPKIDKDATSVTLSIKAAEKAPVVKDHKAMISGSGGGVSTKNPADWKITVEEKSGK